MSRLSRSRVAVATGLTLGTATAGLLLAPSAFAADAFTAKAPATVVAGDTFTVSGGGCATTDQFDPALVAIVTDSTSDNPDDVFFGGYTEDDGTWSFEVHFPEGTEAGDHLIEVGCGTEYAEEPSDVVDLHVTVTDGTAAPAPSGTAAPSSSAAPAPAAAEFKPGARPNTPGIGNTTTSKTTGNAAAPGQKVVKVLKGFQPYEKVTLVLHSTPVTLGTFTADANGVVTAEFTVPAGTPLGNHTLAYTGDKGSYFEDPLTLTKDGKALAYTGADVKLPLIGGTVLLAAGAGALVVGRRRRTGAAQA